MALTTQTAGGLVAGAFGQPEPTMAVMLNKAICIAGVRVEPGRMTLPKQLAVMLIGANKAERVANDPPAVAPPVEPEVQRAPRAAKEK
jgi:hypothetical protein